MKEIYMTLQQWQDRTLQEFLITYAKKEEVNEKNGDLAMETVFADFPFKMDGSVVISDGTKVVSTNESKLLGLSIEKCNEMYLENLQTLFP